MVTGLFILRLCSTVRFLCKRQAVGDNVLTLETDYLKFCVFIYLFHIISIPFTDLSGCQHNRRQHCRIHRMLSSAP